MQTRQDVAAAIGITDQRLCFFLYAHRERLNYRVFQIPKRSGGTREISAPPGHLLWLQKRVYALLSARYSAKACVHGFVPTRSIVTNARPHVRMRHIVNFDLRNFFPSIHIGRVKGVFRSPPFSFGDEAAEVISQICCRDDGSLPQGGAMSPFVSNFVCRNLDNDLLQFARKLKIRYSRYADDLTFSTSRAALPEELINIKSNPAQPGARIDAIVLRNGFEINTAKVAHQSHRRRQEVTGIVVNEFPNVRRPFLRAIEGAIYAWEKHGGENAQREYETKYRDRDGGGLYLQNVIRGRIAYLNMVRGESDYLMRRLIRRFNRLATHQIAISSLATAESCRLRSPVHNTGGWNHWIERFRSSVFLLQIEDSNGRISCGSAFHIGHSVVATAGHNLVNSQGMQRQRISVLQNGVRTDLRFLGTPFTGQSGHDIGAAYFNGLNGTERIPTQLRLPECGEEVLAIGFPTIPLRNATLVAHVGTIEALPTTYNGQQRFIQVSFQSGGGLSGGCLIDKAGYVVGIMVENVFMQGITRRSSDIGDTGESDSTSDSRETDVPPRPYGQAVPMEYFDDFLHELISQDSMIRSLLNW